jgi:hypothetical protein
MHLVSWSESMSKFLTWTVAIAAVAIGVVAAVRAVQISRVKLKNALGQAEAVADRTRAALEQTESALHDARTSL